MSSVRELLNAALYLSISDREFSPAEHSGSQINASINRLNEILEAYKDQVPYLNTETLTSLEDIDVASISYLQYVLGDVLQPMLQITQQEFSRLNLVVGLKSIPAYFFHDKANEKIEVYPNPMTTSDEFIMGYLPNIHFTNLDEALPSAITGFYKLFLEYELARGLCDIYNVVWTPQKEESRRRYYSQLLDLNQRKLTAPKKGEISPHRDTVPWLAYLGGLYPK
jgi:hypothetical protein